jgi:hypothetical protein
MSTVIDKPSTFDSVRPNLADVTERKFKPVKIWALVGVFWIALTAYAWGSWLYHGANTATTPGPDKTPGWMLFFVWFFEIGMLCGAVVSVYFFMIKPWRREHRIPTDGLFIIAFLQMWTLQDPLTNYTQPWFDYNSNLVNFGCPQCWIPGWHGSRLLPEPVLWGPGCYVAVLFPATILCCYLMRRAKQRWPQLGTLGLIGVALGFMIVADFVAEMIWVRTGSYTYPGSYPGLTFFSGHYYQFPIYESLFWGATWAAFTVARYFKNDKGQTLAERGIDEVRGTNVQKTGLRLLAIIGILNCCFFFVYNVPTQWLGSHSPAWPADIIDRSYLSSKLCGQGTNIACPGPRVPIDGGNDSAHLTPQGTWYVPQGVPTQIPAAKKSSSGGS